MALGSESAAEKTATKSNLDNTKDVVQALIETLVDPRLPFTVSVNVSPSENAQTSVARQMHAVVLLYNYYHRKQNSELEFLNFESFCILAISLRPSLTSFMNTMNISRFTDADDNLSLTEKAIKDACDISMALDASKDYPITDGWPISKVAVLLIDSKMENCLLNFGAITEGVWSLIEKEVIDSNINLELSAEENVGKKRKRNIKNASTDEFVLLKLVFKAVKDAIGIDSSELVVLESCVTYSLSKEKSAAQFFMIRCPQSFSVNKSVPLKFLIESLEGPLANETSSGWATTPVVEYFHMLPYVEFISCWLSGKDLSLVRSNGCNAQRREPVLPVTTVDGNEVVSSNTTVNENTDENQKRRKYSDKVASPISNIQNTDKDVNSTSKFDKRCETSGTHLEDLDNERDKHEKKASFCDNNSNGLSQETVKDDDISIETSNKRSETSGTHLEDLDNERDKHEKKDSFSDNNSNGLSEKTAKDDDISIEKSNERSDFVDPISDKHRVAKDDNVVEKFDKNSDFVDSNSDKNGNSSSVDNSRELSQMTVKDDDIVIEKFNKRSDIVYSAKKKVLSQKAATFETVLEKFNKNAEISDSGKTEVKRSDERPNGSLSGSSNGIQILTVNDFTKSSHECKNDSPDGHNPENDANLKGDLAYPLKSNNTLCRDKKVLENNNDTTLSSNQNGIFGTENQLVPFEANTTEKQNVMASVDVRNALALLYMKRQELGSQIIAPEDMLAVCEDNIERIRDGGDVDLARKCVECILSRNFQLLVNNEAKNRNSQTEKQTKSSDIYLPGKSSFQDLEYICLKNNWRLPRYIIEPSNGKFEANVVVEGKDLKLSSKGGLELNPCDARESAAAQMILKLQSSF